MMDRVKEKIRMGEECAQMLNGVCQQELDELAKAILHARRIFVAGWGRAGNMIKILSMNCSQAGLRTFVVGDNGTPAIGEEDLLVIGSGSGETKTMCIIAQQAKEHGAKLALVTGSQDSTIGRLADLKVVIPKPVRPEGEEVPDGCGGSIYPVFNMVADTVQSYLAEYMSLVPADIGFNHNNLE
ncbi:SIS domain-containing protein [Christensenellaceae bacterium 44-20]